MRSIFTLQASVKDALLRSETTSEPSQKTGRFVLVAKQGRETFYTVLFYLSECGGGETVFYSEHNGKETARIVPTVGSMLLHRHGVDCWQHEALPVAAGTKYILRTDVVFA